MKLKLHICEKCGKDFGHSSALYRHKRNKVCASGGNLTHGAPQPIAPAHTPHASSGAGSSGHHAGSSSGAPTPRPPQHPAPRDPRMAISSLVPQSGNGNSNTNGNSTSGGANGGGSRDADSSRLGSQPSYHRRGPSHHRGSSSGHRSRP
jgi:hypothetical protein